jgi:hypothetical protein
MAFGDWLYMRVRAVSVEKSKGEPFSVATTHRRGLTCWLHDGADAESREEGSHQELSDTIGHSPLAEVGLGEIVSRELDRGAHGRTKHGGVDTAGESLDSIGFDDGAEGREDRGVVVLSADGVEGGVGLHAGLDEEEWVTENGCGTVKVLV